MQTKEAAAPFYVQIVTTCPLQDDRLPIFCKQDIIWLLEPTLKGQYKASGAPLLGVCLSVLEDAHPDVLILCHKKRILLLQLPQDELENVNYPGLELLKDLLLCSSPEEAISSDPLQGTDYPGIGIQLTSVSASETAYLFFHAFQLDSCIMDLDRFAQANGYNNLAPLQPCSLIKAVLGKRALKILSLEAKDFLVKRKESVVDSSFLSGLAVSIRLAIGSYEASSDITDTCRESRSDGLQVFDAAKLDIRRISPRLKDYMSRFEAVEIAMYLTKPKMGQSKLRKITSDGGYEVGIEYKLTKQGNLIEVINEQYKTRLAKSSGQLLEISLVDKMGQTHSFAAKTVSSSGKTSTLSFIGKDRDVAMDMLRSGAMASVVQSNVDNVETRGRENHSAAELEGMRWRREIILCNKDQQDYDPSNLLCPFLLGDEPESAEKVIDQKTIKLMKRPQAHKFNIIAARESKGTLNASQAKAARAILSPLDSQQDLKVKSWSDTIWNSQERLVLIHGPPGTGKTSLITACCEQWQSTCSHVEGGGGSSSSGEGARDTIYACCQSNVAVKNIGESFSRANINFKIIVSPNFYVEWHEDLYNDIEPRLIRSDDLPNSASKMNALLDGCNVILCTISFLSSPKVVGDICPLFTLRPMRLLFVDEASQIHLRAYPHLLQRFGNLLARIIFLGDDRQLPPFKGEEVIDAGLSVFELSHLRKKAFLLDTCYRLAKPLATFISKTVYDSLLISGSKNFDPKGGLLDCISYVDVETSREEKQGTSRMNAAEIDMVIRLVAEYKKRGGNMINLKVLTTYDAQRDALEDGLKRQGLSGASDVVFSVDSFQGRESDYIILSLVKDGRPTVQESKRGKRRSDEMQVVKYLQPGLGFLSDDRRINVALTRAKKGTVVVSNRKFILNTAAETLVGKLQIEMQWLGEGGEVHWYDEDDILNQRMPRALFESLPRITDDRVDDLANNLEGIQFKSEPCGWD